MSDTTNCTICLQPIENDGQHNYMLGCNHRFHTECIVNWFRTGHSTCPICRNEEYRYVSFMDAEHRAKYYRRSAKKKDAPPALKKAVRKIIRMEKRKKNLYKEKKAFENEYKELIKKYRKLNDKYYNLMDKIQDENHILGIRNFFETPQFYVGSRPDRG